MGCFIVDDRRGVGCITVSVVSHGQGELIGRLLPELMKCPEVARIILTLNLPEADVPIAVHLPGRVVVVRNRRPHGFGVNHNAAFKHCETPFFCVLNPDIRLPENPFPALIDCLAGKTVALSAPVVLNPEGGMEDSARCYPTLFGLLRKALGGADGRYVAESGLGVMRPDWLAGMFMLFRSEYFASLGGFDEGFYLYYEDVDICARLKKARLDLVLCPHVSVLHDARRTSRRNARYMLWHARSMGRYFFKHPEHIFSLDKA